MNLGKVYRIASLKRMGNNAIMHWLLAQYEGNTVYLNEVAPFAQPFFAYGCNPIKEQWNLEAFFYRNEDWPLSALTSSLNEKLFEHPDLHHDGKTDILILRDPFNHLASRHKMGCFQTKSSLYSYADLWIILAREFSGKTNLSHNKICINYNKWKDSIEYRKSISEQFGTQFSDEKLNEVAQEGGGSSFDSMQFQGEATRMDTTQRWKHFLSEPRYLDIFRNREFYDLTDEIFGIDSILDEPTIHMLQKNFSRVAQRMTNLHIAYANFIFPLICKLKYTFRIGTIGQLKRAKQDG